MRKTKLHSLLTALLCGAALLTFACKGGEEVSTDKEAQSPQSQVAEIPETPPAPQVNELRPEPKSVEVEEEPLAPVEPERTDLEARERELAEREAALDARERRLRQRRETPPPPPVPAPEPEERQAEVIPEPEPVPEPEPAREEPVFEEPQLEEPEEPEPIEEPLVTEVTVPAGTRFDVEITSTLASNTTAPGETFRVRVAEDVMEDGEVAIPAGSEILGEVVEAVSPRRIGGQAKLELRFTDLVLPSGATVPIEASFVQQGRSETGRDAATIGGGAAAGAILGRVLKKGDRSKGSVIGAIIGAAAGAVIASRTPGEEVVIPRGTVMGVRLDDSVRVRVQDRR
jgi:type IV secretory pathway VirB10-like protein